MMEILPFQPEFGSQVIALILAIQRDEFGMQITAEQQPDLAQIPTFYQSRGGNFWVARSGPDVVGALGLLDIGAGQGALRKMFVRSDHRGPAGTADLLLDTLLAWSIAHSIREILLGTTPHFLAAHRFYEKRGFSEIDPSALPASFPIMSVDKKFYRRQLSPRPTGDRPAVL